MALSPNVSSVITRIATEFKNLRTSLTGNASGSLTGLTTTNKDSLVGAINEVAAATAEGAGIDDEVVGTSTTYSSSKIEDLVGDLQDGIDAKPSIADGSTTSTSNTWSVSKIASELANVDVDLTDLIDDETASTSTVYSSAETEARIGAEVAALVGAAPETLDTLEEIATAIGNNEDALDGLVSSIGDKVSHAETQELGAPAQARARTNIGAASQADLTTLTNNVGNTDADFVQTFEDGLD